MRSRSADSIMARAEILSIHQQAGYMYASLSRCSIEESSCIRGGSIYDPLNPSISEYDLDEGRGRKDEPKQAHGGADDRCAEAG